MFSDTETFLPYNEPGIVTILVQSSFLLILNVVNTLFDKLLFCGLLGQVFIGTAWGTPGAKWLSVDIEDSVVQLGYLGLILLVYEGGLGTNFSSLNATIFLSVAVAVTGITFPIALSFVLLTLVGATPVQAFAAGAALCSTSLGTTFTILSTSGLSASRLGTVLTTAAMMDDVVGLVMVRVISNLGESDFLSAVTVVRPLAVSIGFALATPIFCRFIVGPVTRWTNAARRNNPQGWLNKTCGGGHTPFVLHTLILISFVTTSSYAGTSNLFASYLAGAAISWWDSEVSLPSSSTLIPGVTTPETTQGTHTRQVTLETSRGLGAAVSSNPDDPDVALDGIKTIQGTQEGGERLDAREKPQHETLKTSGNSVYHTYYGQAVQRMLKPFFFASIGFAIPITEMFTAEIVWRGIVYTVLMVFAKAVTGLWLVRIKMPQPLIQMSTSLLSVRRPGASQGGSMEHEMQIQIKTNSKSAKMPNTNSGEVLESNAAPEARAESFLVPPVSIPVTKKIDKPLSLYPAVMLSTAMTARGEIGFLIASLAETTGIFASSDTTKSSTGSSEIYLVVVWAIVLCTIIGPLTVGTLVKRIRRLQSERSKHPGNADPLGIWGVI